MIRATYIIIVIALSFAAWTLSTSGQQAMSKCQERHSFDTCFYTLNR